MEFKIVRDDDELYIRNKEDLTLCRLVFFEGGKEYKQPLEQWLVSVSVTAPPSTEIRRLVKELTDAILCLTQTYVDIFKPTDDMPWQWVRAHQIVKKAQEWMVSHVV